MSMNTTPVSYTHLVNGAAGGHRQPGGIGGSLRGEALYQPGVLREGEAVLRRQAV